MEDARLDLEDVQLVLKSSSLCGIVSSLNWKVPNLT